VNSLELREIQALNTLVFETLGEPESEREFKFKALKKWGLDLLLGRKDGKEAFFVAEYGKRKEGEVYTPREVIKLLVEILDPKPKQEVYYQIEKKLLYMSIKLPFYDFFFY